MNTSQAAHQPKSLLFSVAALSLIAGLIHLWVMPEHFEEWWGYATFFLVAAAAQVTYVPLLLRWPTGIVLLLGIAGNSAIVRLYLLTRVVGIPLFGPEAGDVVEDVKQFRKVKSPKFATRSPKKVPKMDLYTASIHR
jgi:hypothetical protein